MDIIRLVAMMADTVGSLRRTANGLSACNSQDAAHEINAVSQSPPTDNMGHGSDISIYRNSRTE